MNLTDEALIQVLSERFAQSRKAFADLTVVNRKLMEMNHKLEESESLKTNFLSNIRNEINDPLSGILGLAGGLASLPDVSEEVFAFASMICSEANALDFQLRNIFAAAELEAGQIDPHLSCTDVASVVNYVIESFRHGAARKMVSIELLLQNPDQPLLINTDAEKLQLILSNLLANAVEFSPEGGVVQVSISPYEAGGLLLRVQDYGLGIASEDIGIIFDRFVQLETGTTRSHAGHGLGLCITKALIDLLQGTISVESSPGNGAVFTIILPPTSIADNENSFSEGGNLFIFDKMSEK